MEALEVRSLHKRFGDETAVEELSFALQPGQFGVLLGPSGAGKTTVLNLIAGLLRPDGGDVRIGDVSVADVPPERRDVAMVFENYALYPHRRVRANLEFPLHAPVRAKELSRAQIARRVEEVAEVLRIGHLLDRLPSQLSGGQRQRVSLGRALVRRPRLLLLDEPITHLDAKLRHEMRTELKRIQQELGTTTLYATPDQADALALGDVVVVLEHGRVWQIDDPATIYAKPAHVRVAEIVGAPRMNLLAGNVVDGIVQLLGRRLPAPGLPGGAVTVGVRPADVEVGELSDGETLVGTVSLRQPLGYAEVVYLDVGGAQLRAVTPPGQIRRVGETVGLRLRPDRLHYFDRASGVAISRDRSVAWPA